MMKGYKVFNPALIFLLHFHLISTIILIQRDKNPYLVIIHHFYLETISRSTCSVSLLFARSRKYLETEENEK